MVANEDSEFNPGKLLFDHLTSLNMVILYGFNRDWMVMLMICNHVKREHDEQPLIWFYYVLLYVWQNLTYLENN